MVIGAKTKPFIDKFYRPALSSVELTEVRQESGSTPNIISHPKLQAVAIMVDENNERTHKPDAVGDC